MKKILLILLAFLFIGELCIAQGRPLEFEGVVTVSDSSRTKDDLFVAARRWFSDAFKDSKNVLTISDKESGELAGNGSISFHSAIDWCNLCTKGYINFKIAITVKNGKYRYNFYNFEHDGNRFANNYISFGQITTDEACPIDIRGQKKKWEDQAWKEIQHKVYAEIDGVIALLKLEMDKSNINDW